MSIFQNSRVYFLAFVAYWGIVVFGYDTGIAGGVITQDSFKIAFLGGKNATTTTTNNLNGNVVSVLQAGAFVGALASAVLSSHLGRKLTLLVSSLVFLLGAILQTVAGDGRGIGYIYAGRVIAGVGVGAISAVAPAYVAECSPKEVRGRITGLFQIMVASGGMLSYFVNYGVSAHGITGPAVWRIAFGFQLVPAGIMCIGLLACKDSPRWLAQKGRTEIALHNLAYLRKSHKNDHAVRAEMAEIVASIIEEREAREGLGWREAFLRNGNWPRFLIAFVIFLLQQFSGQSLVGNYAPQIFRSIGYTGTTPSLLASGIYGVVKVAATSIFVLLGIETLGRKKGLIISSFGMGTVFFMIGGILKAHPPGTKDNGTIPPASRAMAGLLYIYVCFYSLGWGPVPWVYVADIFPTRTRHYGLSVAIGSQWLFSFVVTKVAPFIESNLQWKLFMLFAAINIGGMGAFSLLIPETKGKSLEEMDILFGAISADQRGANIERAERSENIECLSVDRFSPNFKTAFQIG